MTGMGTSPFPLGQSPSYHSNSYMPKFEANYLQNFTCCELVFGGLHELLQHQEENHSSNGTSKLPGSGARRSSASRARSSVVAHGGLHGLPVVPPSGQLGQQQSRAGASGMGGVQQRRPQQPTPVSVPQKQVPAQMSDEMDAVGDMELDEPVGRMEMDDHHPPSTQQNRHIFGHQRPQLHLNSTQHNHPALRTSAPTTPAGPNHGFGNNPTVSSVNTPTLTTQQGFAQQSQSQYSQDLTSPNPAHTDLDMAGIPAVSNLNFANNWAMGFGTNMAGLTTTIDDPARRLFSHNGPQLTAQQQQALRIVQTANIDASQLPPGADPNMLLQQLNAASLMVPEEPKPYKCPVVGCEKAYKNQNGLKYVNPPPPQKALP